MASISYRCRWYKRLEFNARTRHAMIVLNFFSFFLRLLPVLVLLLIVPFFIWFVGKTLHIFFSLNLNHHLIQPYSRLDSSVTLQECFDFLVFIFQFKINLLVIASPYNISVSHFHFWHPF